MRKNNVNVDIITGFNNERDNELFKYKLILNVSWNNDCKIIETFRCDRCIYNKMIVISNLKDELQNYYLYEHMIFVDYNKILETVLDVCVK